MTFIDTSAYLSILLPTDPNRSKATQIVKDLTASNQQLVTSFAVLGEVLTVGSMRFDRKLTIKFVEAILSSQTIVISERKDLLDQALEIFKQVPDKDVGFVDCYSFAIIKNQKIETVFSFDRDFNRYADTSVLN